MATLEMTSLAFMLVDVPEPVWKMSTTKASSNSPSMTRWAAATMAAERSASRASRSRLTSAAHCLTCPMARMKERLKRRSLMGKLSSARRVFAP